MASDLYTVRVASEAAGMVVRGSAATLEPSLPTTAIYEDDGTYIALSDQGKVHMVAATDPTANATTRIFVGIRNHKRKTVTLLPAAGEQVVRLRPRLADRTYDAPSMVEDVSLGDRSNRIRRNTELVQQFGSRRRVRQMGQREVTRTLEGNVANRGEMEAAIEDLGNKAKAAGLTTAQVMGKLAAERSIPIHNPDAQDAENAYQISALVTSADLRHMHASHFLDALKSPAKFAELQSNDLWKLLDPFVRFMLHTKQKGRLLETEQDECSQWLALYQVCRKILLLRSGVVLDEGVTPLEGPAEEAVGDEEEEDPFAAKQARVLHLQPFAAKSGFVSPAAVVHFAQKFGSLEHCEQGMTLNISDREKLLIKTTLAVCAIRCNKNRITMDMGRALIKTLRPFSPKDVTGWLRDIGCRVAPVKKYPEGEAFTAALLTAHKNVTFLSDTLPKIRARKTRKKA